MSDMKSISFIKSQKDWWSRSGGSFGMYPTIIDGKTADQNDPEAPIATLVVMLEVRSSLSS
jgi:hypothetical protein